VSGAAAVGIDAGSTALKAVVIDGGGRVLARFLEASDPRIEEQAARAVAALASATGRAGLPVGATGYGRKRIGAAKVVTEITCHARGGFFGTGRSGVLVDIGGQDTKVIRVGERGEVLDFAMNDKCAAGTGRFLEVILERLRVPLEQVASYVERAAGAVPVTSTCTVFAESEVVSLVARGEPVEGIVKGLHAALARRVASLVGTVPPGARFFLSGGVALNPGMVAALSQALPEPVSVLPDPQFTGALGAALSALALPGPEPHPPGGFAGFTSGAKSDKVKPPETCPKKKEGTPWRR
jgi:predicted CoA-substrate-specific enzyme activase